MGYVVVVKTAMTPTQETDMIRTIKTFQNVPAYLNEMVKLELAGRNYKSDLHTLTVVEFE